MDAPNDRINTDHSSANVASHHEVSHNDHEGGHNDHNLDHGSVGR